MCRTLHEKLVDLIGSSSIPVALVGNKSDLHLDRQVSREDGQRLAQSMKAAFLETSARNNQVIFINLNSAEIRVENGNVHLYSNRLITV